MDYKYIELKNRNNLILRGIQNLPENTGKNERLPAVIIVHGHTGNKMGNAFFFVKMSKFFTSKGFTTFRFDFTGSGESDGEFEDMTLTSELNDMDNIYKSVETNINVDRNKIFIIGHSMGGLITTLKAYEYNPKKIILLAPANDMYNSVVGMYNSTGGGREEIKYGGLKIKKEFMDDMGQYKPYEKASLYKGDVLIFRGSEDIAVPKGTCIQTEQSFPGSVEYLELKGIDHSFTDYDIRIYIMKKIYEFIN